MSVVSLIICIVFVVIYIVACIVGLISTIQQYIKCRDCKYKFPGCQIETTITTLTECAADRIKTQEDYEYLKRMTAAFDEYSSKQKKRS